MMIEDETMRELNESLVHELPQILIQECSKHEAEDGFVTKKKLAKAINDADVGLSSYQVYSVISDGFVIPEIAQRCLHGENGDLVDYSVFINEHVAPAIAKLIDVDFELARHEANVTKEQLETMTERAYEELGMTADEFCAMLKNVFITYDKNENGFLEPAEFEEAINSSGIEFSEKEKMMLYLASDEDGNGQISYGEFAAVALQLLIWAKKEQYKNPIRQDLSLSSEGGSPVRETPESPE